MTDIKHTLLRIIGNILVIYGLILFILVAYYNGKQFGVDVSIINYIIRVVFGFAPSLLFILPGASIIISISGDIEKFNKIEEVLCEIDRSFWGLLKKLVMASFIIHLHIIMFKIIIVIIKFAFSFLSVLFSIFN